MARDPLELTRARGCSSTALTEDEIAAAEAEVRARPGPRRRGGARGAVPGPAEDARTEFAA